jgi:outer membrane usher protein
VGAEAAPIVAAAAIDVVEMLVQVDLNQQGLNETVIVLRAATRLLIAAEDLRRWRLRTPDALPYFREGRTYFPLDALPGVDYRLDEARQTLAITTGPEAFIETVSTLPGTTASRPILPQPGSFLNYAVSITDTEEFTTRSGLFEAGLFTRHGVLTSSLLAPALEHASEWRRLETTYTVDYPQQLTSLRLGDTVTRAGAWGIPVRFAGIQYGTKFATQPGFIPFPLATALGQAALPSTVDVFVNNALVTRRSVPPGPFSIAEIPVVTGSGDIRVVVRDLLGREQVFIQPFYGSTGLLKRGVSDYSFELGAVREDFGIASSRYGEALGVATYRRGFSDAFTGELRGEHAETSTSAGASAALLAGRLAILNASVALSDSERGAGSLLGYGFEHNGRRFSASLQSVHANREFRQAGMQPAELPRRRQHVVNVGLQLEALGSVSFTHAFQDFYDRESVEVSSLAYRIPAGRLGQFGVSAIRTSGPGGGTALLATFAMPLGEATSASLSLERTHSAASGERDQDATASLQKSPPLGEGFGYRLQLRGSDLYGSYRQQTAFGAYDLEAARQGDATATRFGASGGVARVGGYSFLSREITESFGVVRVADFPDVRVLHDNQVAARTDARGYAVLPRLRAYDRNPIAIDQRDLPFDAAVGALRLHAVPYFRSGVFVDFPVRRVRAATLRVVLEDGGDLPSGALVRIEGSAEEFPVALGGQAYVEGLEAASRLVLTWRGQRCLIDVSFPPGAEPLPDLGTFVCKGVRR